MYNRRNFIQASAAVSSVSVLAATLGAWPAGAATAVSVAAPGRIDFYKVVFDREHPAAVAFGQVAGTKGLPAQAIGRDVTALWYDDLYHRWRQGPAAIAGMTPPRVAYCLQVLAQDSGLRMVFRAEHMPAAEGGLAHRVTGPKAMLDRARELDKAADWPRAVAQLIAGCPADFSGKSTVALNSPSASGCASRQPLVSWVIAAPPSGA
jgi:hypothetical protein